MYGVALSIICVLCCSLCPADGTISSSSILLAQSLLHNLQGQSCSPTELFYQGNAQPIREWLTVAITRALHQGEESLLELTKQICCFLQVCTGLTNDPNLSECIFPQGRRSFVLIWFIFISLVPLCRMHQSSSLQRTSRYQSQRSAWMSTSRVLPS